MEMQGTKEKGQQREQMCSLNHFKLSDLLGLCIIVHVYVKSIQLRLKLNICQKSHLLSCLFDF